MRIGTFWRRSAYDRIAKRSCEPKLHLAYYNFCRVHRSLRVTPARSRITCGVSMCWRARIDKRIWPSLMTACKIGQAKSHSFYTMVGFKVTNIPFTFSPWDMAGDSSVIGGTTRSVLLLSLQREPLDRFSQSLDIPQTIRWAMAPSASILRAHRWTCSLSASRTGICWLLRLR